MRNTFATLVIGLLMSMLLVGPGLSQDKEKGKGKNKSAALDPKGEPKQAKGKTARFAIWNDKKGWHLQTMIPDKSQEHRFRGVVRVEGGTITRVEPFRLEKKGNLVDHWQLDLVNRQALSFDFKTRIVDGVSFQVSPTAKAIHFDLGVDTLADTGRVVIGERNQHPGAIPFSLPAHPGGGKKGKKKESK
jgi:hypothetical protein